ncbi:MAG: hypothetical protein EON95_06590 [Caulobacteraceae bacterium]|nr:MAG: hypothetical protein EON95_06590 [Caulobacteraceae bacterium]
MSKEDAFAYGIAGAITWLAVTAFYGAFGAGILESSFLAYAANAALATAALGVAFCITARLRRTPRGRRAFPALVFFAPGLIGGMIAMLNLQTLFPHASQGRYGAFLLVAYAAVAVLSMERPGRRV